MVEDCVIRSKNYVGSHVGHVGTCSQRTRGEESSGRFKKGY